MQDGGVHSSTVLEEFVIMDPEACDRRGPSVDGDLRHHVHVEGVISADGRQLDDITSLGV